LVNLSIGGTVVKSVDAGESFGELALLHGAPRSASCRTVKDSYFWCLDRKIFKEIVNRVNSLNFEENKKFVESIPILNIIENEQKTILCSNLVKEIYETGDHIVKGNNII
jgi:cAMP-dependent protein kinase regulator